MRTHERSLLRLAHISAAYTYVYGLVSNRQIYSALRLLAWLVGRMQGDVSDHQSIRRESAATPTPDLS